MYNYPVYLIKLAQQKDVNLYLHENALLLP